jgi:hypothetical protein
VCHTTIASTTVLGNEFLVLLAHDDITYMPHTFSSAILLKTGKQATVWIFQYSSTAVPEFKLNFNI